MRFLPFICMALYFLVSCTEMPDHVVSVNKRPAIYPDYTDLTLPVNIAPLNFKIQEKGEDYMMQIHTSGGDKLQFSSQNGTVKIPVSKWKRLLHRNTGEALVYKIFVKNKGTWKQYKSFSNKVSASKVDPFLYYRVLYPGYESWREMQIVQRNLENFKEKAVIENNVVEQNCVNCHSFNHHNADNFMFHMRGSLGGTYLQKDGELKKIKLKTKEMTNGTVYPRWHPSGNFVAFSSNKVIQQFHAKEQKKIEVSDLNSSLVLYDVVNNEMMKIPIDDKQQFMDTYPEWSPDGKYLYFCRARQIDASYDYRDINYNLYRVRFNPELIKFEEPELVVDAEAMNKSISFPRMSPEDKTLVFTLHDYGCFSIWHQEADLYALDVENFSVEKCALNSDYTESYHSWSSNGRWMVFSSKRGDGLSARPYISFVDEQGKTTKPFVLPQKDPHFYKESLKTFNIPEFAQKEVDFSPGKIRRLANTKAISAEWVKTEQMSHEYEEL